MRAAGPASVENRAGGGSGYPDGLAAGDLAAVALGLGETVGVGLGVGVLTTTAAVGQPKGTGEIETWGVGEVPGDAWAWIRTGVVLGQGGGTGIGVGEIAFTTRATRTARPPSPTVPTKVTAPHSRLTKSRFNLGQAPSRPIRPRHRCQDSHPMLRACCRSRSESGGPSGLR